MADPSTRLPQRDDFSVQRVRGWQRWVLAALGWGVRAWGASLRFEASPASLAQLTFHQSPTAITLWHNRLFLAAEVFRRYRTVRPAYALVSASKDGAWLEGFFAMAGMRTVRGSSSRLGREAVSLLVEVLRAGNDIGITPDGPRGPRYEFKPGGVVVVRRVQVPVLLLGGIFEKGWVLPSWDGFVVPAPFSRVRVTGELVFPQRLDDRDAAVDYLTQRLLALNLDEQVSAAGVVL